MLVRHLSSLAVIRHCTKTRQDYRRVQQRISSVVFAGVPRKRPILRVATRQNYQWHTVVLTEQSLRWQNG
ncbi:hypothetical protein TSAR_007665 [Trichomalopsis sarcophagae]|uniref:Uncharacterized protein n=1 Tax=Trichomalopsis sarcophagae TaxID=543379 RepID=A0A232FE28_9HYME|nr:hypothetical protein TSAR_007665 [Trichomalopsis sarcophagae]